MNDTTQQVKPGEKKKTEPHIRVDNRLFDFGYTAHMPPAATVCYLSLVKHRNNKTLRCDPSIPTLAKLTGLSARSVLRAIDDLVALELIAVQRRPQNSNLYQVLPLPDAKPEFIEIDIRVPGTAKPVIRFATQLGNLQRLSRKKVKGEVL